MTDREQIVALMEQWRRRTAEGDLQGVLALMTNDAVFITPGRPPFGREEYAKMFATFAGKVKFEADQEIKDFHASGDMAYAWSHLAVTMTPKGGAPMKREGDILTVFRRGADGKWRLARDANFVS